MPNAKKFTIIAKIMSDDIHPLASEETAAKSVYCANVLLAQIGRSFRRMAW